MTLNYITIKGYIRNGKLDVTLPENVQDGEAEVIIPIADDETPFADEEIREFLTFRALPAEQIVTGGWEHRDIGDSVEWAAALRRREEERGE
jgi:hypothetical protein